MKNLLFPIAFFTFHLSLFASTTHVSMCLDDTLANRWMKETNIIKDDLEVRGITFDYTVAKGNHETQFEQAKTAINKGAKVLIIVPVDGSKAKAIVEYAHSHDTKVIAYSRLIHNCQIDYYMGFHSEEIGKQQAQYVLEHTNAKNIMILGGPSLDINSQLIRKGQFSVLDTAIQNGHINIVTEKSLHEWSGIEAFSTMENFLNSPHDSIDAVISCTDMIASGALDALEIHHINASITGSDAEKDALLRIQNGEQLMTILLNGSVLAHQTSDLIYSNILTKNHAPIKIEQIQFEDHNISCHLLEPILIDKKNLEAKVKLYHLNLR